MADLLVSTSLCSTPFVYPVLRQIVPKTEIRKSGEYEDNLGHREADPN